VSVDAVRKIDSTHAAPAKQAIDLVWPYPLALWPLVPRENLFAPAGFHQMLFGLAGRQQRAHLAGQQGVPFAPGFNQLRPQLIRGGKSLDNDRLNAEKAFGCLVHCGL
jgi:hypothetical protein